VALEEVGASDEIHGCTAAPALNGFGGPDKFDACDGIRAIDCVRSFDERVPVQSVAGARPAFGS
jgi:hypothetical protein